MLIDKQEAKIREAIIKGETVEFQFEYLSKDAQEFIVEVLFLILFIVKKTHLKAELVYILREFVANANKSNLKRAYFKQIGMNIMDPGQYQLGMMNFGKEFRKNIDTLVAKFKENTLFTRVAFQIKDNILRFSVRNTASANPQEIERVKKLIEDSKRIHDAAEAFLSLIDNTEGAGLGTVTTMLMLRSLGLSEKNYSFVPDPAKNETAVGVAIPLETVTEMQVDEVSEAIVNEIVSIPMFPENLNNLERLISQGTDFSQMSNVIQRDPALTAELLKIVNSAQYMLPQRVSNITNALSLIGIRGLKGLLYSYGAQNILGKKYGNMDLVWEHSFRTASYAYHIAADFGMKAQSDDAYTGGILHDLGKIVVLHAHPGLLEKIYSHLAEKGVYANLLEGLTIGLSHTKIGSQIARKWNFPDNIADMIGYHHYPLLAPEETQALASVVYLADNLTHSHEEGFLFASLEKSILERFNIYTEEEYFKLEKKLDAYYQEQKRKSQENAGK